MTSAFTSSISGGHVPGGRIHNAFVVVIPDIYLLYFMTMVVISVLCSVAGHLLQRVYLNAVVFVFRYSIYHK